MLFEKERHGDLEFIKIYHDNFKVVLSNLGASIFSISFYNELMTQTVENISDFKNPLIYHGKTIGRVCNRLPGNKIQIDGQEYELENNEGPNTLHGGKNGLSTKVFNYEIKNVQEEIQVIFSYLSKDKESGFPGNLLVKIVYLISPNKVEIIMEANSDSKTLCSLTNHTYFCLGETNVKNLELMVKSEKFLHPNPIDLLPVEIREVNQIMDFNKCRKIGDFIDKPYLVDGKSFGYDHYYYFLKKNLSDPQVSLRSKKYILDIFTDFSGVQIYTDNWPDNVKYRNSSELKNRGIAIEPSESQKDLHYLNKDESYKRSIILSFSRR